MRPFSIHPCWIGLLLLATLVILGWLRSRDKAIAAYQGLLEQKKVPVESMIATQLKAHIARVRIAPDLARVEPFRNPWLE